MNNKTIANKIIEQQEWKAAEQILAYASEEQKKEGFKIRRKEHMELQHSFIYVNGKLYLLELHDYLGRGGFGKVKVAKDKEENQFAIKVEEKKDNEQELKIMEYVSLLQGKLTQKSDVARKDRVLDKEIKDKFYTLQKLIPGQDLYKFLRRNIYLPEIDVNGEQIYYFGEEQKRQQIALLSMLSILKLHSKRIIHGDIKPQNFMVNEKGDRITVAAADFGGSVIVPKGEDKAENLFGVFTPTYGDFEIVKTGLYSFSSDVYALGVMLEDDLGLDYQFVREMRNPKPSERIPLTNAITEILKKISLNELPELIKKDVLEQLLYFTNKNAIPIDNLPQEYKNEIEKSQTFFEKSKFMMRRLFKRELKSFNYYSKMEEHEQSFSTKQPNDRSNTLLYGMTNYMNNLGGEREKSKDNDLTEEQKIKSAAEKPDVKASPSDRGKPYL